MSPDQLRRLKRTVREYGRRVPEVAAGSYVTDDRRRLMVGFVEDVERHAAELRSRAEDPDLLGFFRASFTERELEEALDEATENGSERTIEKDGFSVDSGWIDIERNAAVIEIWTPDPAAAAAKVRECYGPAVRAEVVGGDLRERRPHPIDTYEPLDDRRLRAHSVAWPESEIAELVAREAPEAVTLDLFMNVWLGSTRLTQSDHTAEVKLSAPLGSRVVIDGHTGKRVPARDANWYAEQRRRDRY